MGGVDVPEPVIDLDPRRLVGVWTFDRLITDRMAGEELHVDGTVTFSAQDDDLVLWREQGTLHRGVAHLAVERTLQIVRRPGGSQQWDVTFEDGREFHPWSPQVWVEHLCGADTYRGLVLADGNGQVPTAVSVTWEVSGPRKDYTMVTRLTR